MQLHKPVCISEAICFFFFSFNKVNNLANTFLLKRSAKPFCSHLNTPKSGGSLFLDAAADLEQNRQELWRFRWKLDVWPWDFTKIVRVSDVCFAFQAENRFSLVSFHVSGWLIGSRGNTRTIFTATAQRNNRKLGARAPQRVKFLILKSIEKGFLHWLMTAFDHVAWNSSRLTL